MTQPKNLRNPLEMLLELQQNQDSDSLNEEEIKTEYTTEDIEKLKSACQRFLQKETFETGQLVKWKQGLKNRKLPHENQPAVVIEILGEPVINPQDESGSPYFLERLDIILGIIVADDSFLTFYYDSRRFENY